MRFLTAVRFTKTGGLCLAFHQKDVPYDYENPYVVVPVGIQADYAMADESRPFYSFLTKTLSGFDVEGERLNVFLDLLRKVQTQELTGRAFLDHLHELVDNK